MSIFLRKSRRRGGQFQRVRYCLPLHCSRWVEIRQVALISDVDIYDAPKTPSISPKVISGRGLNVAVSGEISNMEDVHSVFEEVTAICMAEEMRRQP